jgi:hypothetical protein
MEGTVTENIEQMGILSYSEGKSSRVWITLKKDYSLLGFRLCKGPVTPLSKNRTPVDHCDEPL